MILLYYNYYHKVKPDQRELQRTAYLIWATTNSVSLLGVRTFRYVRTNLHVSPFQPICKSVLYELRATEHAIDVWLCGLSA